MKTTNNTMTSTCGYRYAEHPAKFFAKLAADDFDYWMSCRMNDEHWYEVSEAKVNDMMDEWDEVWDWPITYDCGKLAGLSAQFSIDRAWFNAHRSF